MCSYVRFECLPEDRNRFTFVQSQADLDREGLAVVRENDNELLQSVDKVAIRTSIKLLVDKDAVRTNFRTHSDTCDRASPGTVGKLENNMVNPAARTTLTPRKPVVQKVPTLLPTRYLRPVKYLSKSATR